MTYEYTEVWTRFGSRSDEVNRLARDGWEPHTVAVPPVPSAPVLYVMRRPVSRPGPARIVYKRGR